MTPPVDPSDVRAVAATLGRELCRPLDEFEAELGRLLRDPPRPLTDAERGHAQTMLKLCEELRALTRESLGAVGDGPANPPG